MSGWLPNPEIAQALAVGAGAAAALGILTASTWRWLLSWLAVLQLALFRLLWGPWPLSQAVAWLVAGWLAIAVLGLGQRSAGVWPRPFFLGDRLFRWAAGILGLLAAFSLSPRLAAWLTPVGNLRAFGSLTLLILGLLHLGLSAHPLRVAVGLLTVLGGFVMVYALLETSLLLTGLLAAVEIALALSGGYLILLLDRGES